MADLLQIWNRALGHVGVGSTLAEQQEESAPARAIRRFWPGARDTVLAEQGWLFANRTMAPVPVEPAPHPWRYAFLQPADCIAVRAVYEGSQLLKAVAWETGGDTTAQGIDRALVLTDTPLAYVAYTRRVEDVTRWPAWFADAVSWRLAWEIAMPLSQSRDVRADCLRWYQETLERARVMDARQQRQDEPEGELLRWRC